MNSYIITQIPDLRRVWYLSSGHSLDYIVEGICVDLGRRLKLRNISAEYIELRVKLNEPFYILGARYSIMDALTGKIICVTLPEDSSSKSQNISTIDLQAYLYERIECYLTTLEESKVNNGGIHIISGLSGRLYTIEKINE